MENNETVSWGREQLEKKCRIWKRTAITALSVLVLGTFFGVLYTYEQAVAYKEEIAAYQEEIANLRGEAAEEGGEIPGLMDGNFFPPPGEKK